MRIEDGEGNGLTRVHISLTRDEAGEMVDSLRQMLEDPRGHDHEHVSDHAWLESGRQAERLKSL